MYIQLEMLMTIAILFHWDSIIRTGYFVLSSLLIRGLWCTWWMYGAGMGNCIPQNTVGSDYLFVPHMPASDAKKLVCISVYKAFICVHLLYIYIGICICIHAWCMYSHASIAIVIITAVLTRLKHHTICVGILLWDVTINLIWTLTLNLNFAGQSIPTSVDVCKNANRICWTVMSQPRLVGLSLTRPKLRYEIELLNI